MKIVKYLLILVSIFVISLFVGGKTVFSTYTSGVTGSQIQQSYWTLMLNGQLVYQAPAGCPPTGCIASPWQGPNTYAGFYQAPNGLYYPIGTSTGGGGGPSSSSTNGVCTGVYDNCSAWTTCSPTCGPGTQTQACYDTGCGTQKVTTQSCMINDPTIWGSWSTCSLNCGGGTQTRTNQCGTVETQNCNTQACGPWVKLKNSSFFSTNSLTNFVPPAPIAYGGDDTTSPYFIIGNDGLVAAPSIMIDTSGISQTAYTGNPEYKIVYTPNAYAMTPSIFYSYITARKQNTTITNPDLSEITGSGVYTYTGDLTINSNAAPFNHNPKYNIVLVTSGTVTINPAPDNTFSPTGSVAIVAQTINFDSTLTQASGIFVANTISTGTNVNQGLKIVGNLIAQSTLTQGRSWPSTSKPAVFIKFDQSQYINLLPYLSTASYDWQQTQ